MTLGLVSDVTILDAAAGRLHDPLGRTKRAIIGAGPSRAAAPFGDPSWLIYGINEIAQPRADVWWELHPMDVQNDRELRWLATMPLPTYVLELVPEVPHGVRYPLERVLAATGGRRYFTSTFAFQVALAITEGATEIGVWGVDLDLGTLRERTAEKACLEYWLGMAAGRGIRVTLPEGATLLTRPYLYGYDYHDEKANIEAMCADLVTALPQGEWPEGTVARITEAYDARVRARAAEDEAAWQVQMAQRRAAIDAELDARERGRA